MRSRMLVAVGAALALLTLLIPLARSAEASTKSDCEDDPSASITACITQHYETLKQPSRSAVYALLVAKVFMIPLVAALISLAAFFFLSTLIEPLLIK